MISEVMRKSKKPKIIVILGPTASGKSTLAVHLAKKFGCEVISADSRQVYRGLDIGTGKITRKEMRGIPHHMLDIVSPKKVFTAGEFKKEAEKIIRYLSERTFDRAGIERKGNVPIVAGGTGFYIDVLLGNTSLPEVPPNKKLRGRLDKKTTKALFAYLKKLDPKRAKTVGDTNRPRLIRAIEIAKALGYVPSSRKEIPYKVLKIGIRIDNNELKKKIRKRLFARLRRGMVAEVRRLHEKRLSWKRMYELGLEYRYISQYLTGKLTRGEMIEKLNRAI